MKVKMVMKEMENGGWKIVGDGGWKIVGNEGWKRGCYGWRWFGQ